MSLLEKLRFIPFFVHRNGTSQEEALAGETVLPAAEPVQSREERRPSIPVQEVISDLEEFILEQPGVEEAFSRVRVDGKRLVRVRIEVYPASPYRKYRRKHSKFGFATLANRLARAVSRETGIPEDQVVVKRNLKIPHHSGSSKGPSHL